MGGREGGRRERGAPGRAGAVSPASPHEARGAGPGPGGALCGSSPGGEAAAGGGAGARSRGATARPGPARLRWARLAPQLLPWHLQDCGGLRGWAGEGGPAATPTPPPAALPVLPHLVLSSSTRLDVDIFFFFNRRRKQGFLFFFCLKSGAFSPNNTAALKRKQPTSVGGLRGGVFRPRRKRAGESVQSSN